MKGAMGMRVGWGIGIAVAVLILLWLNVQYGFHKNIPSERAWYASELKEQVIQKEVVATVVSSEINFKQLRKTLFIKPLVFTRKIVLFYQVIAPFRQIKSHITILKNHA